MTKQHELSEDLDVNHCQWKEGCDTVISAKSSLIYCETHYPLFIELYRKQQEIDKEYIERMKLEDIKHKQSWAEEIDKVREKCKNRIYE